VQGFSLFSPQPYLPSFIHANPSKFPRFISENYVPDRYNTVADPGIDRRGARGVSRGLGPQVRGMGAAPPARLQETEPPLGVEAEA